MGRFYVGGPIGGSVRGSLSAYTRSTDGQFDNSFIGCDDCVDYFEETGAIGRLMFGAGDSGEIDVKVKASTVESGAINFNASLALAEAAAFLGAPPFQEDANAHPFVYLNNVSPVNEQDNLNVSIKGEWDLGGNTLTAIAAYNEQDNFFLTDGTSAAFFLYSATASCVASNDARAADTPLPAPFFYAPSGALRDQLPAALQPDDLRRLPVPAARPVGREPRGPDRLARATSACAGSRACTTPTSTGTSSCRRARTPAAASCARASSRPASRTRPTSCTTTTSPAR